MGKDRIIVEIDLKDPPTLGDARGWAEVNDLICSKLIEAGVPIKYSQSPISGLKTFAGVHYGYVKSYDDPITKLRVIDWSITNIILNS